MQLKTDSIAINYQNEIFVMSADISTKICYDTADSIEVIPQSQSASVTSLSEGKTGSKRVETPDKFVMDVAFSARERGVHESASPSKSKVVIIST